MVIQYFPESSLFDGIPNLRLNTGVPFSARAIQALASCTHLSLLAHLELTTLGNDAIANLVAAPWLEKLIGLNLGCSQIGDAGLEALAAVSFKRLSSFCLQRSEGSDLSRLANAAWLETLVNLELSSNRLGDAEIETLAAIPFNQLRSLSLGRSDVQAIDALVSAPWFRKLTRLDLGWNSIDNEGAIRLASVPFERLTYLNLEYNGITDVGFRALATSPYLAYLNELRLGDKAVVGQKQWSDLRERFS